MSENDKLKRAIEYHREGFNCAESIFLAFRERVAPELSPDTVRMATPFGGGLGYAGCLCGALTGAVMILGILEGRTSVDVSRKRPYALSKELHNRFMDKFGSTCCRVLKSKQSGSNGGGASCAEIIMGTEEILSAFIRDRITAE